ARARAHGDEHALYRVRIVVDPHHPAYRAALGEELASDVIAEDHHAAHRRHVVGRNELTLGDTPPADRHPVFTDAERPGEDVPVLEHHADAALVLHRTHHGHARHFGHDGPRVVIVQHSQATVGA